MEKNLENLSYCPYLVTVPVPDIVHKSFCPRFPAGVWPSQCALKLKGVHDVFNATEVPLVVANPVPLDERVASFQPPRKHVSVPDIRQLGGHVLSLEIAGPFGLK